MACFSFRAVALLLVTLAAFGCRTGKRTFQAQKINTADSCVAGIPAQVLTLHQLRVQWRSGPSPDGIIDEQGRVGSAGSTLSDVRTATFATTTAPTDPAEIHVTTHLCRLPLVYGVDAIGTPFGTDDARIELYENGTLKKAEEERDHQIDELISSVTEAADQILPRPPGFESGLDGANPYAFFPPLPPGAQIIEILEITPLQ